MKENQCENLLKLYESEEKNNMMIMIIELCNTDLDKIIRENYVFANGLPEELVIYILKNLALGFSELHQRNIIHRDIKLENIFVKFPDN
jgi:calcium-dependent protein kinase